MNEILNDKITTETRTKQTPYNAWNKINRSKRNFSDDFKIKRNGKMISLKDFINENNRDCTIYQVLETYRGDKKMTAEALNKIHHMVSDELMEINSLANAFKAMKEAENSWRNLPLEIRKQFDNDISNFKMNGLKWANQEIEKYNKKVEEFNKINNKSKTEIKTENLI